MNTAIGGRGSRGASSSTSESSSTTTQKTTPLKTLFCKKTFLDLSNKLWNTFIKNRYPELLLLKLKLLDYYSAIPIPLSLKYTCCLRKRKGKYLAAMQPSCIHLTFILTWQLHIYRFHKQTVLHSCLIIRKFSLICAPLGWFTLSCVTAQRENMET